MSTLVAVRVRRELIPAEGPCSIHYRAPILLDIAISCTALCRGLGFHIASRGVFNSLAIGCFACSLGWSIESGGAPPWLVVAGPIPLDSFLLWYLPRKARKTAIA